jgi:hypothetical protein
MSSVAEQKPVEEITMTRWQSIFMQSPANSGFYYDDELPRPTWQWPKGTWFQERLDYIREHRLITSVKFNRKIGQGDGMRTM